MNLSYGWCKGLKLKSPTGMTTRPTSARVREAFMSMMMSYLPDGSFLDLFAGSGAIGLDAISRGANGVIFVENDRFALKALKDNVAEAKRRANNENIDCNITIYSQDVGLILKRLSTASNSFSIVWADPPYEIVVAWLENSAQYLENLIAVGGFFALESSISDRDSLNMPDSSWELFKEKKYGDTILTIWQKK